MAWSKAREYVHLPRRHPMRLLFEKAVPTWHVYVSIQIFVAD
jgi:hypothetical protein